MRKRSNVSKKIGSMMNEDSDAEKISNNDGENGKVTVILTRSWKVLSNFLFLLPALLAIALQRVFNIFPTFVEYFYSNTVFRWISTPISFVTSAVPFSMTEMLVIVSIPLTIVLLIMFILRIKKSENKLRTTKKTIKRIGWILSISYMLFMFLLGFNYARMPLSETLDISVSPREKSDLESVCYILLDKTNTLRETRNESLGVMTLKNNVNTALKDAYKGYSAVSGVYPILKGYNIRAKGVLLSHQWSYTGITGMYFPFFVEANVNIDIPHAFLPNTILHEIAHTRGIAREDEAGFVAFITGIHHPDDDFKYSSYLDAFIHTSNALYSVDKEAYDKVINNLSTGVKRDLNANSSYWKQFEGPVQEVSSSVNNAYLQSNLQKDGVRSYGRVVDLLLGYYLS